MQYPMNVTVFQYLNHWSLATDVDFHFIYRITIQRSIIVYYQNFHSYDSTLCRSDNPSKYNDHWLHMSLNIKYISMHFKNQPTLPKLFFTSSLPLDMHIVSNNKQQRNKSHVFPARENINQQIFYCKTYYSNLWVFQWLQQQQILADSLAWWRYVLY